MSTPPNRHLTITGIAVDVLGAGRMIATVEGVEPAAMHGMPGLMWRVRTRLPDGTPVVGRCMRDGRVWFDDPRVSRSTDR